MKTNSTQQQAKRETAKAWYDRLQRSSSLYRNYAYNLKKQGFTYCEIMDFERCEILSLIENRPQSPIDLHKKNASILFNVPYESVTEKQRQVGKLDSYKYIYGCSTKQNK